MFVQLYTAATAAQTHSANGARVDLHGVGIFTILCLLVYVYIVYAASSLSLEFLSDKQLLHPLWRGKPRAMMGKSWFSSGFAFECGDSSSHQAWMNMNLLLLWILRWFFRESRGIIKQACNRLRDSLSVERGSFTVKVICLPKEKIFKCVRLDSLVGFYLCVQWIYSILF